MIRRRASGQSGGARFARESFFVLRDAKSAALLEERSMKSDAELARIYRTRAESLRACKTGTDAEAQTRLEELAGTTICWQRDTSVSPRRKGPSVFRLHKIGTLS
jgi:hypothetical protein